MMDEARTSGTSANIYQTARRYKPEDSRLFTEMVCEGVRCL
jgi:hypothetical protein